jgi:DNA-binding transcriptional LysR family regulator
MKPKRRWPSIRPADRQPRDRRQHRSPAATLLPGVIGLFKKRYPQVTVSLIIADTAGVVAGILEGALEFGVVGAESRDRNILQEKLTDDQMRLIVPAAHPWAAKKKVPLASLLAEPYIARERGSGTLKSIQDSLARLGHGAGELKVVAEMGSGGHPPSRQSHVGVSILSSLAVAEDFGPAR